MTNLFRFGVVLAIVAGVVACKDKPAAPAPVPAGPPKPGWEYTPDDFSIGHKHTHNAGCNRQIDKLLDEIRTCFNTHAAAECATLQKKNSQKMGTYIKSPRCAR